MSFSTLDKMNLIASDDGESRLHPTLSTQRPRLRFSPSRLAVNPISQVVPFPKLEPSLFIIVRLPRLLRDVSNNAFIRRRNWNVRGDELIARAEKLSRSVL